MDRRSINSKAFRYKSCYSFLAVARFYRQHFELLRYLFLCTLHTAGCRDKINSQWCSLYRRLRWCRKAIIKNRCRKTCGSCKLIKEKIIPAYFDQRVIGSWIEMKETKKNKEREGEIERERCITVNWRNSHLSYIQIPFALLTPLPYQPNRTLVSE